MASQPPPQLKPNQSDAETAEAEEEADVADAARPLQQQIVYNGEVLDIAFESVRTYKEGTQSLVYLDAAVSLAYALLRMLERWSKRKGTGEMYVRKKAKPKKRKRGKNVPEGEGVPDVEEEPEDREEEEVINETMFTFDQFEQVRSHPASPSRAAQPTQWSLYTLLSDSRTQTSRARSSRTSRDTRSSRSPSR